MTVSLVTVLVCTYNRSGFLRETLRAITSLPEPRDYGVEVLVVDNNSSDDTADVVRAAARSSRFPVRLIREPQQGKSFALNEGLRHARGEVIALTDDDVWPDHEWLDRIVGAFRTRDITFAFGKVRPRWDCVPAPELLTPRAHSIWGPLAILDYGDEPVSYVPENRGQRLPIGANLAIRRQTLVEVGGWRTDLGKVDNSLISGEDHEIFYRLRKANAYRGLYDPRISVRHFVPTSRLTRRYFRQWFYWHGKTLARMPGEVYELDFSEVPHVAGAPRFLYRQFLQQAGRWLGRAVRRNALETLIEELQAIEQFGVLAQYWQRALGRRRLDAAAPSDDSRPAGDELAAAGAQDAVQVRGRDAGATRIRDLSVR